ncbi:hypothetical protein CCHR01_08160, partial [Colletotrichum chrysophilum]
MREALAYFRAKYESALGDHMHPSNPLRASLKKVEFRFREAERLKELQDNINTSTARLTLVIILQAQKVARVNNATMRERMHQITEILAKQSDDMQYQMLIQKEQSAGLRELMLEVCAMGDRVKLQEENDHLMITELQESSATLESLGKRVSALFLLLADVRDIETRHRYFAGPDPTFQKPIIFEDALGFVLEIPLKWIRSWN